MFERFTDSARRAIIYAGEVADGNNIHVDHLVLGILHEPEGNLAVSIIRRFGIAPEDFSVGGSLLYQLSKEFSPKTEEPLPKEAHGFAPDAQEVMQLAMRESLQLGQNFIGPEHILLGILRQAESRSYQLLTELGVTHREAVHRLMDAIQKVDSRTLPDDTVIAVPLNIQTRHLITRQLSGLSTLMDPRPLDGPAENLLKLLSGKHEQMLKMSARDALETAGWIHQLDKSLILRSGHPLVRLANLLEQEHHRLRLAWLAAHPIQPDDPSPS